MKLPKVGAIVVNYNNPEDTRETLQSLLRFTGKKNFYLVVYLVNNGCTDLESVELKKEFLRIVQIDSKTNLGFAGGNNIGIKQALKDGCSHILLINNDATIVSDNFFDVLLSSRFNVSAPLIECMLKGKTVYDYGGKIDYLFGRNTHLTSPGKADYFSGACLFISSEVFKKVPSLDDSFFLYYEDADFCLKARAAGLSLGLVPEVQVFHRLSVSTNKLGSKKIKILALSHYLFCSRHLPSLSFPFYALFNLYLNSKRVGSYLAWRKGELSKTLYPLLNKFFCLINKTPEIHLVGDSHVLPYYLKHPFVVHHLIGATAFNLTNKSSSTHSYQALRKVLAETTNKNTLILFQLGEIDCRLHIFNQYLKQNKKVSLDRLIATTIDKYLSAIEIAIAKGFRVAVLSLPPTGTERNIYKKEFFADFKQRSQIVISFNILLKKELKKRKVTFINLYPLVSTKEGGIKEEYKQDVVHLNEKIVPLTLSLLSKENLYNKP